MRLYPRVTRPNFPLVPNKPHYPSTYMASCSMVNALFKYKQTAAFLHATYTFSSVSYRALVSHFKEPIELELELIQTQMTQKPMLRAEVGMRVRCANKASAECIMRGRGIGQNSRKIAKSEAFVGSTHSAETMKRKARERSS